jgi:hypothetical protein
MFRKMRSSMKSFGYLIESLRPTSVYYKYVLLTCLIFAYLLVWLGMSVSYPFYENGAFVYYARSIIYDGDLNIFNQVSQQMQWLVTSQMYHPDFHAIGLTPILTVGYFLAWIVSGLESSRDWMFYVVTACLNVITVYFSVNSLRRLAKIYNFESTNWCWLAAMISPAFLIFALTKSTVLDVMLIPLLTESIIALRSFKHDDNFKIDIPLYWIIMLTLKSSSYHLVLITIFLWILEKGTVKSRSLWIMFVTCHLGFLPELIFDHYRYGELILPRGALIHLFNWDLSHVLKKMITGYFFPGGMFFTNPNYLLGVIVFVLALIKIHTPLSRLKTITMFIIIGLVGFNLFQFLPLPGRSLEVHIPGRIALPLMPFFVIGFSILDKSLSFRTKFIILTLQIFWALYIWAGYISQDVIDSHSWITQSIKDFDKFYHDFVAYVGLAVSNPNLKMVKLETLVFSSIICSFLIYWCKKTSIQKTLKYLSVLSLAGLVLILVFDRLNHKENIRLMTDNGEFQNVVVGSGREIFFFDYFTDSILEVSKTISEQEKEQLPSRVDKYYSLVEKQVIKSNSDFDKILKSRNVNFGYHVVK